MVMKLYEPEFLLGLGHDSITGETHELSVVTTPTQSLSGGQHVLFSLNKITSHEDLTSELEITAQGSLGNAVTGGGSFTARFSNKTHVNSFSVYLLVSVQVFNPHKKMVGLKLTDEAFNFMASSG